MSFSESASAENTRWNDIYRRVIFQVKDLTGELICFTAESAENYPFFRVKRFAIITALNPRNQKASDEENKAQNLRLETDLKKAGYLFYVTRGELDGHAEESFTVEGISEKDAVLFGAKYRQHAILYHDERGVRFVLC